MGEWFVDWGLPVVGAVLAGALIGYEREFRGHSAGLRTHTLISLASAVLILSVRGQTEWVDPLLPIETLSIDPTRMSHGILTGIGFLCGGVIFKEGLTVHGLTTAATLWISSVVGILFGEGSLGLAAATTVLTLLVLTTFKFLDMRLPGLFIIDATLRFKGQSPPSEGELAALLRGRGLRVSRMSRHKIEKGDIVEYAATLRSIGRPSIDDLATALEADKRLIEYSLSPRND